MEYKTLGLLIFWSLLSCAPIQIEDNLEAQFSSMSSSQEDFSSVSVDFLEPPEEKLELSMNYSVNFIQSLSDTIYENSFCSCRNNEDCTRGCSHTNNSCRGSKVSSKPTEYCMRHITGSIMHVIDRYCRKMNKHVSREQCLEDMEQLTERQASKYNICRQSLFYPSALCVLNIDGQNRINSNTIKSKSVRNNCIYYNKINDSLRYFYTSFSGELQRLPIFIEIPFSRDPESLPDGSIIVLQSSNPNGHVEIKTNKKACKDSYCFCSDFCVSRKGGWKHPFKPLAVFKWNPLFINYLGELDED